MLLKVDANSVIIIQDHKYLEGEGICICYGTVQNSAIPTCSSHEYLLDGDLTSVHWHPSGGVSFEVGEGAGGGVG